jgi:hypothetical protein
MLVSAVGRRECKCAPYQHAGAIHSSCRSLKSLVAVVFQDRCTCMAPTHTHTLPCIWIVLSRPGKAHLPLYVPRGSWSFTSCLKMVQLPHSFHHDYCRVSVSHTNGSRTCFRATRVVLERSADPLVHIFQRKDAILPASCADGTPATVQLYSHLPWSVKRPPNYADHVAAYSSVNGKSTNALPQRRLRNSVQVKL